MRSKVIEERKKIVRKLEKESRRLWTAQSNLGYIILDKPIRNGWHKELKLRDDIAKRKDADLFKEILKVAGYKVWGRDIKHLEKVWTKERKKNHRIQYPGMRIITKYERNKLSYDAKKWLEGYDWYWTKEKGTVKRYRCKVPSHFFQLVYTRAFITKLKIFDPLIDSRLEEIEEKLLNQELYKYQYSECRHYLNWGNEDYNKRIRRKTKMALRNYDEDKYDKMLFRKVNW